jgi:hypothetical protein
MVYVFGQEWILFFAMSLPPAHRGLQHPASDHHLAMIVCKFRDYRRQKNYESDCSWNGCPWGFAISDGIAFGGQAQEGSRNSNLPLGLRHRGRPFRHYLFSV